jgi:hypothetical protein
MIQVGDERGKPVGFHACARFSSDLKKLRAIG